ncbi:MAG: Gfo/Idh/MocA family oxidoreductase [Melioribacteraceae bacterium]|nr:Gfo/Idh/MocA family oxidoreductase [Melioribacteraceae bacterium]
MSDSENKNEKKKSGINRRDMIKGLAALPVFGGFLGAMASLDSNKVNVSKTILQETGFLNQSNLSLPALGYKATGSLLRVGIIGVGNRGQYILRGLGFVPPGFWADLQNKAKDNPKKVEQLKSKEKLFLSQEYLNVALTGVCDIFDYNAEIGIAQSQNQVDGKGGLKNMPPAKRYKRYQDLITSDEIDAVIIATPDHWHAQMVIDAANAGKHIYVEKALTRTEDELIKVEKAVKESGVSFQLGHQLNQSMHHIFTRDIIRRNILGKVNLVELCTNRNDPNGAWLYNLKPEATEKTVDWEQFQSNVEHKVPFSPERFFRWRCWFDYSTGIIGDLLSHDYAAANFVLYLGVPSSVTASGGVYIYDKNWPRNKEFKVTEPRDTPDVITVNMEYPDRGISVVYTGSLGSDFDRTLTIMGTDATLEYGRKLRITADRKSTRYKKQLESGVINSSDPMLIINPGGGEVDAISSATEKYFAKKGLFYTSVKGKKIDTTHLHIKDWLNSIRHGTTPLCNIKPAMEEGITVQMATKAYLEGRRVRWDSVKKKIV